jgi:hypothetical protein
MDCDRVTFTLTYAILLHVFNTAHVTLVYECYYYYYYYYYYLTAIGLTPGNTSTHLHTNSTQNTEDGTRNN